MISVQSAPGDVLTIIGATAGVLAAWFGLPKVLHEVLALWRDRSYRRAKRAAEFAKEFPDEPTLRQHALRLASAALINVEGLTHEQRMAFLAREDVQTQARHQVETRRWLDTTVSDGQIVRTWRRAELANPQCRRREQWKLFFAYLGYLVFAFLPLTGWRLFFGSNSQSLLVPAVPLLAMAVFLLMAVVQPFHSSSLHRAVRVMAEQSSAGH